MTAESDRFDGYEQYNFRGWDGYDGLPITPETLRLAKAIDSLLSEPPHIAPGGDGTIGFEWLGHNSELFLDISDAGISIYARIDETTLEFKRVRRW